MKKLQDLSFLVVDDMPNMRRTIRNMLTRMGVKKRVMEAEDGDKAWDILQLNPIDFVICDWNMPRMKGIEVLRKMRNHTKFEETPFLMLTAEVDEKTIAQAAETEIDAYIIKPFILKTLVEKIEEALKRRHEPSETELIFKKGQSLLKEGLLDQALKAFEEVQRRSPNTPKVYMAMGDVFFAKKEFSKAKEMYEKSISLSEQYTGAMDRLAKIYGMEGRTDEQVELLKKAVQISPDVSNRQLQLGKALLSTDKNEEAAVALETALRQDPQNSELAKEVGEAYLAANMNDQASKAFKKAIDITPKEVEIYNRLGIALRKQKKYVEAIKEYRKALNVDPKNEIILYNISVAYYNQGMIKEAKEALQTLIKQNPDHTMARKAMESMSKR